MTKNELFKLIMRCNKLNSRKEIIQYLIYEYNKLTKYNGQITIEIIISIIEDFHELKDGEIHIKTRKRKFVQSRQEAMYFAKKFTKLSLREIGKLIGDKDHATVLHACRTINNLIETNKNFKEEIEKIESLIKF